MSLDLVTELMAKVPGRCAYAEARFVERREEALSVRAGQVDEFAASESEGSAFASGSAAAGASPRRAT